MKLSTDGLRQRARKLKRDIPALIPALRHPKTPMAAKILAAVTVCYALSPVDLIPDFIPVLGYLDDVLLLPGLVYLTLRLIPDEIIAQCRQQSSALKLSRKWYFAIPIVLLWAALFCWLLHMI